MSDHENTPSSTEREPDNSRFSSSNVPTLRPRNPGETLQEILNYGRTFDTDPLFNTAHEFASSIQNADYDPLTPYKKGVSRKAVVIYKDEDGQIINESDEKLRNADSSGFTPEVILYHNDPTQSNQMYIYTLDADVEPLKLAQEYKVNQPLGRTSFIFRKVYIKFEAAKPSDRYRKQRVRPNLLES